MEKKFARETFTESSFAPTPRDFCSEGVRKAPEKGRRVATLGAVLGHILEHYDITLYGFFAASLAPLYFPNANPVVSLILSMGTFALGFVARPLGGIVFGYIGDKFGRRRSLLLSIFFVTLPTLVMGILPTYSKIGLAAPIILIICRLLQGFCVGGEYAGAAIYINETCQNLERASKGSILCASGFAGALLGTLVGALCTCDFFPHWGWRLAFILGGVLGLLGFSIRRFFPESHEFSQALKSSEPMASLKTLYTHHWKPSLCIFFFGANGLIPLYLSTVYMNNVFIHTFHLSQFYVMIINGVILAGWMLLLPIFGYLADSWGSERFLKTSTIMGIVLAYPLFLLVGEGATLWSVFVFQGIMTVIGASFVAPLLGFMPRLFPVRQRYRGVAFNYTLGQALLGGTTPLIATFLAGYWGNPKAPFVYLILGSLLGLLGIVNAKPRQDDN